MINTIPIFYYDFKISAENFYINFNEGLGERTALVSPGNYSAQELANEVTRVMNEAGDQVYLCSFNRALRLFSFSAPFAFDLLVFTGSNAGLSAYPVLGFIGADLTGLTTYQANEQSGKEFIPQFSLQNFVDFEDFQEFADAKVNESASGEIEVYTIGQRKFMEFAINYSTNFNQGKAGIIRTDSQGVEKIRDFLRYCITKGTLEFMPDMTDRSTYQTIILETTEASSSGTGYKLNELYSKGLPGYFDTGSLKWRLKE
jgi:hypothetical protein